MVQPVWLSWRGACVVGVVLIALRAGLQAFPADHWRIVACDVVSLLRGIFAMTALLWASRLLGGTQGRAWRLLAIGAAAWVAADVVWLTLAITGSQPWGSLADVFFLLFYPLFLVGVLSLPRDRPSAGGAWAALLDALAIVVTSGALLWTLLVGPLVAAQGPEIGPLAQLISLAYPIGDLLLLWAALDLLLRGRIRSPTGVPALLAGGALLLIIADLIFSVQMLKGTYSNGNPLGILWSMAVVLMALAGARQATCAMPPEGTKGDARMASAILATMALMAVFWLAMQHPRDPVVVGAAAVVVLLMLLRQIHAMIANRHLEDALRRMNEELERRVQERTAELEAAHRRLGSAERLEAVGRVAGAVAHDFNNILTAVSGHAELAGLRSSDPAVHEHIRHITEATQRAADLGRRLMSSSRPMAIRGQTVDAVKLVEDLVGQFAVTLPPYITLQVEQPASPLLIYADAGQLHQVLMNLCGNARDAMPDGGRLTLRVAGDAAVVRISVSDTGVGMDEAVLGRLFEPYFTTKGHGRGNGLGLSMSRNIIAAHRGTIQAESVPGSGSTFTITLPCSGTSDRGDEQRG